MPAEKVMSPAEALEMVESGMRVGLGGTPLAMNPVALVAHLVLKGVGNLDLVLAPIGGFAADLLLGAGLVRSVEFAQIGFEEMGMAPNFRRLAQEGAVITLDHT